MTYTWPSSDPEYWQDLVEYVMETDHEADPPSTFGEFIVDFSLYMTTKKVGVDGDGECECCLNNADDPEHHHSPMCYPDSDPRAHYPVDHEEGE
jgi:hypothetical protein